MRYPLAGSMAGPLEDSGTSRCFPIRTPSGAIAGMLRYGSPATPGTPSLAPANAETGASWFMNNSAAHEMAKRFSVRVFGDWTKVERFILLPFYF